MVVSVLFHPMLILLRRWRCLPEGKEGKDSGMFPLGVALKSQDHKKVREYFLQELAASPEINPCVWGSLVLPRTSEAVLGARIQPEAEFTEFTQCHSTGGSPVSLNPPVSPLAQLDSSGSPRRTTTWKKCPVLHAASGRNRERFAPCWAYSGWIRLEHHSGVGGVFY